jgi:lipid-A-disaccharide synthase
MAVIFPFEEPFYRKHHVPVTFVGHPLLDRISPFKIHRQSNKAGTQPVIGLLPGSRDKEVSNLLPVMLEAAKMIRRNLPTAMFVVSCAESIQQEVVMGIVKQHGDGLDLEINTASVAQVFEQSQLLVAASGTVTLEAALHGIPTVIVYKVSPLSYWLGKRLIKVKHIGIVNLIVDNALLPELIQDDASPRAIAETVTAMISDRTLLKQIEEELVRVRNLLGGAGASDRVAGIALDLL